MRSQARTLMLSDLLDPDGRVDPDAWTRAHTDRTPVARCGCGGAVHTAPGKPWESHFGTRWYATRCEQCGHEAEWTAGRQFPAIPRTSLTLLAAHAEVERRRLAEL